MHPAGFTLDIAAGTRVRIAVANATDGGLTISVTSGDGAAMPAGAVAAPTPETIVPLVEQWAAVTGKNAADIPAEAAGWTRVSQITAEAVLEYATKQEAEDAERANVILGACREFCEWLLKTGQLQTCPIAPNVRIEPEPPLDTLRPIIDALSRELADIPDVAERRRLSRRRDVVRSMQWHSIQNGMMPSTGGKGWYCLDDLSPEAADLVLAVSFTDSENRTGQTTEAVRALRWFGDWLVKTGQWKVNSFTDWRLDVPAASSPDAQKSTRRSIPTAGHPLEMVR